MKEVNQKKMIKDGLSADKKFMRTVSAMLLTILLCAFCMGFSAFAMFSHSSSVVNQPIKSAVYTVNKTLKDSTGQSISADSVTKAFNLSAGQTYTLNLTSSNETNQATTGFVLMTVTYSMDDGTHGQIFYSPAIGEGDESQSNYSVKLCALCDVNISFVSHWGEYAKSGLVMEQHQSLVEKTDQDTGSVKIGVSNPSVSYPSPTQAAAVTENQENTVPCLTSALMSAAWAEEAVDHSTAAQSETAAEGDVEAAETEAVEVKVDEQNWLEPQESEVTTEVSGQAIKVQTAKIQFSDGTNRHGKAFKAYFPVFDQVVSITDYEDCGKGEAVIYDGNTTVMPTGLSVEKVEVVSPKDPVINHYDVEKTFAKVKTVDGKLVFESPEISTYCDAFTVNVTYRYQGNAGNTYFYVIQYQADAQVMTEETPFVSGTDLSISVSEAAKLAAEDTAENQGSENTENAVEPDEARDESAENQITDANSGTEANQTAEETEKDQETENTENAVEPENASGESAENQNLNENSEGETNQTAENQPLVLTRKVESIAKDDLLQSWDFFSGIKADNSVMLMYQKSKDALSQKDVQFNQYTLTFEDSRQLAVIGRMTFFDMTDRTYVELNGNNWESFKDKTLMAMDADGNVTPLKVTAIEVTTVQADTYGFLTACDFNAFANGVLVGLPTDFRMNLFKVTKDLRYDEDEMQKIVEKTGLYAYWTEDALNAEIQRVEELKAQGHTDEKLKFDETEKAISQTVDESTFNQLRGSYFKIALEKQLMTKEKLLTLLTEMQESMENERL